MATSLVWCGIERFAKSTTRWFAGFRRSGSEPDGHRIRHIDTHDAELQSAIRDDLTKGKRTQDS